MMIQLHIETASYVQPLVAFANQYGMMVLGAFLLLTAFGGRRLGPFALLLLVVGLGFVMAGTAHIALPLLGK